MLEIYKKSLGMMVLLMLATSSLSATYSFGELDKKSEEVIEPTKKIENCQKNGLRTILTEKIVDGRLEIQRYALPSIITQEDLRRTIQPDDKPSNWAYMCNTYNSGIILFDGKVSKFGDNIWKISSEFRNSELSGWNEEIDNDLISKKPIVQDYYYKIIFSGNTGEFQENKLFMTVNLEPNSKTQHDDNCVIIEGFISGIESMDNNILMKNWYEKVFASSLMS